MSTDRVQVSVVVPILDGADTVTELHRRLAPALDALGSPYEVILVDDGSRDGTWPIICDLASREPHVRGLRLAANAGHPAAVAAGFDAAEGAVVAMIDVDLETYPEDLPGLIQAVENGADLASGRRTARRRWDRELGSHLFNARARRAGIELHDVGCGMNAMRASLAKQYAGSGNLRRTLVKPHLLSYADDVVEVPVRSVRPKGSHLGIGDLVTFWLEFDVVHRRPPWGRVAVLGLVALALAGALAVAAALGWDPSEGAWLAIASLGIGLVAALLVALGLLAGLLLKGLESLGSPFYRVADRVGWPEAGC